LPPVGTPSWPVNWHIYSGYTGSVRSVFGQDVNYATETKYFARPAEFLPRRLTGAKYIAGLLDQNSLHIFAISVGAVFFGAATYIGNGPNFMVKAIAEQQNVSTPSFFGFIFKFALPFLLPVLLTVWLLFFHG
jgi:di/tricarboxylate transporter